MAQRFEDFPLFAELTAEALKIRHRYRRAVETNRPGAARKAELDGLKLYNRIVAAEQVTTGFFHAMFLCMHICEAQLQRSHASEPAFKPVLRKSYALDSWTNDYISIQEGI